jgi:hypothetical protein
LCHQTQDLSFSLARKTSQYSLSCYCQPAKANLKIEEKSNLRQLPTPEGFGSPAMSIGYPSKQILKQILR